MKAKKKLGLLMALAAAGSLFGCVNSNSVSDASGDGVASSAFESESDAFSEADTSTVSDSDAVATITLDGSAGTISDTSYGSSGSTVTVTSPGIYTVSGQSDGVNITVDVSDSGSVYLILEDVTMTNSSMACIYVNAADTTYIQLSGESSLTSSMAEKVTVGENSVDGTIHARDDLIINGSGSLEVNSTYLHGIVAKDDLKIAGGQIGIEATKKGIEAADSLSIAEAEISITSGTDGIQLENDDADSYFYMESGSLTIDAGQDGIQVAPSDEATADFTGYLKMVGGELNVTAGGGSSNAKDESTSQKGIKSEGDIYLSGAEVTISSADDAIHCAGTCAINSGSYTLSSSDDGIHSDSELYIYGGEINVTDSYEGLEAYLIQIDDGTINVVAEDDGVNAAGGSDSDSTDDTFTPPNGQTTSTSTGTLYINGGEIYLNAGGDGLDSNGSIYVTGGTIIVEAASTGDNSAIDYGDTNYVASITGGTVLALGSSEMAVNFNTGTQCSALLGLSGSKGTSISVNDGSGFSYTATKAYECLVYSSPYMSKGSSYTITSGNSSATASFSSSYYYSNVSSGHTNQGEPNTTPGGNPGGQGF